MWLRGENAPAAAHTLVSHVIDHFGTLQNNKIKPTAIRGAGNRASTRKPSRTRREKNENEGSAEINIEKQEGRDKNYMSQRIDQPPV